MKIKNYDLNSMYNEDDFEFDADGVRKRRIKIRPATQEERRNNPQKQHNKPRKPRYSDIEFFDRND